MKVRSDRLKISVDTRKVWDREGTAQPVQWDDALHQDYGKSFFQEERRNYRDILQG